MFAFLLVYIVIVIHASPHNHVRDNLFMQDLTEDSSSPVELANANIFDDGALVSSAAISDDGSTGDLFPSPVDGVSVGALDFGQDFDVKDSIPAEESFDPSLFGVNEEGGKSLGGTTAFAPDSYDADQAISIDDLDSSISTRPCNSPDDSPFESLDSSASETLTDLGEDPEFIASDDLTPKTPKVPDPARHTPSWRYTNEPIYELDPDLGPNVDTIAAYAANGTPLRPDTCPQGYKKSCCKDDTHTECWHYPFNKQLCGYARRLFCCKEIPQKGGPGIDCKAMKWVLERTRPLRNPPSNPPNKLQGVFDIFQFPDLSPDSNPGYCANPSRF